MPELPDIVVYVEHLARLLVGEPFVSARITNPNLLRTAEPPLEEAFGRRVLELRRLGKRIVISLEDDLHLVLHLMIAGRLQWSARPPAASGARARSATFTFGSGTLVLTEAGSRKCAGLHVARGAEGLAALDPGGLEVLEATPEAFATRLRSHSHTLKRALASPRLFSGIGNAYSDEILHRARLSPLKLTGALSDAEVARLFEAARAVLGEWTERLRLEAGDRFPTRVTAFREGMAVHGRFRQPCPDCAAPIQRIVYAEHETNYCARCQTEGRLLADRALSRLLQSDWPRTLDELEQG